MKTFAAAVCIAVLAVALGAGSLSGNRVEADGPDVVIALRSSLESTASPEQKKQVRRLLRLAEKRDDLVSITIDYPLDESVFPPEITSPTFLWHDTESGADAWLVDVGLEKRTRLYVLVPGEAPPEGEVDPRAISESNEVYVPTPYQQSARAWKPSPAVWDAIKTGSVDATATVTFLGYRRDDPTTPVSRGRARLRTSREPVGAPIFYRDVPLSPAITTEGVIAPLPKGSLPLIQWRLRDISRTESRVMLENMPTCANCHSFSADGKTLGMDIDGPSGDKGAYALSKIEKNMVIANEEIITWNSFENKPPGHKTLGFLSRVSPDGRFAITTVNEAIYVHNFADYRFGQVFFPTRGILAYYSRETGAMEALPGADDPEYVHCDPVWSPDGKTIIFARARAKDPYERGRPTAEYAGDPNETQIQYDLYRIPFNEGRGGVPEPVVGASGNGMSNTFPKVSPDGRWIVFVQCKNGQLMRPDGKLWILPFEGGEPRLMRCNTPLMNSWHSFSPNGRWMAFSSKSNTPYTQMFLTHIDENGNDSPAILVENSTAANRAVNLPEFVNVAYDDFESVYVPAVDHYRHYHRGVELSQAHRYAEAVAEFEKALKIETGDSRIHASMSKALMNLGQPDRALRHGREALRISPFDIEMHTNVGFLLAELGDQDRALEHLATAIRIHPRYALSWYNRATLHYRRGNLEPALSDYSEALRLKPGFADAYTGRGIVLGAMGDLPAALDDLSNAIRLIPSRPAPWYFRARLRVEAGNESGALADLDEALRRVPEGSPLADDVKALRDTLGPTSARKTPPTD